MQTDLQAMQKLNLYKTSCISIPFTKDIRIEVFADGNDHLYQLDTEFAIEIGESPYQIAEGAFYEYEIIGSEEYGLRTSSSRVVKESKRTATRGRIEPNIFVGKLKVEVYKLSDKQSVGFFDLEVLATKFDKELDKSYRSNYRQMLEDIAEQSTELLMQIDTPVFQSYDIDYTANVQTVYQRFCFVQSFVGSQDFEEALLQIYNNPSTMWIEEEELVPIAKVRRIGRKEIRQFTSSADRVHLQTSNPLQRIGLSSLPKKIYSSHKVESYDTPENRFIKFALRSFSIFVEQCQLLFLKYKKEYAEQEARLLSKQLNQLLSHPFFNNIQEPQSLKLNSPTLQKRAGYREVLNRWLQFELASKLSWSGGEDVYDAGKKNIAQLYEYWLYFQLLALVQKKFGFTDIGKDLLTIKEEGLELNLKSGKQLVQKGLCAMYSRPLYVKFSYNLSFSGGTEDVSKAGSWTTTLRPDYTLSIWPAAFKKESKAEEEDAIVHIHFDAKYKIQDFKENVVAIDGCALDKQKEEERKGNYKNADLLKMHAYKDAIRRTGGAYVLYPGKNEKQFEGFHEVLPGLGAFSVTPSTIDTGIGKLDSFIDKVISHLLDRTSQRERIVIKRHYVLKEGKVNQAKQLYLPAYFDLNKVDLKDTYVLVGFCKKDKGDNPTAYWDWYSEHKIYNFRINNRKGALPLEKAIKADYLLLRDENNPIASKLLKINKEDSYQFFTSDKMRELDYPNKNAKDYLMVAFKTVDDFKGLGFDYQELEEYEKIMKTDKDEGLPFVVSLYELFETLQSEEQLS